MLDDIDEFWKMRYETETDLIKLARHRNDGRLAYDLDFLKKWVKPEHTVLDLGSGPAVLANALATYCNHITCVEKQKCSWSEVIQHTNIQGMTFDAVQYIEDKIYDVIMIFGVVNHLTEKEAATLYKNCKQMMSSDSILILKSQFGVDHNLYIDHFSKELNAPYQSHYRTIQNEMKLASQMFDYQIFDIYPGHLNPHKTTHHFHLVCQLK